MGTTRIRYARDEETREREHTRGRFLIARDLRAGSPLRRPFVSRRYRSALLLIAVLVACIDPNDATNPDYDPTEITVDVDVVGNGGGRAMAPHPITINCIKSIGYSALGPNCRNTFVDAGGGGKFEIFATADSLSTLAGWSGDCTGITCELSFPGGRDTTFTVRAKVILHAPVATITLPVEGAAYYADEIVRFQGFATDAAGRRGDGYVSEEWTSSRDGMLCSGGLQCPPRPRMLAPGSHVITLTATDAEGTIASTSVSILVRDEVFNDPPVASIHSPDDGELFDTGDNITFSGDGLDPEDGYVITNARVWTSSLDGYIGTGGFLIRTLASAGTHIISFAVEDSEGKSDTARVVIQVTQPGAPASIHGTVSSNGVAVEGATLDLYGTARATTTTDAAGSYSFLLLPAGNYTIDVSGVPDVVFPSPRQTVTVAAGEAARVDFAAADANPTASISGRVTGNGYGIGGATLSLTGPVSATTTSGSDGSYSFGPLPAGTYTISVSTALNVSFAANPRTVTLASGQALIVDFAGTY